MVTSFSSRYLVSFLLLIYLPTWAWWHIPVAPALGRLRLDACEFSPGVHSWDSVSEQNETKSVMSLCFQTLSAFALHPDGCFVSVVPCLTPFVLSVAGLFPIACFGVDFNSLHILEINLHSCHIHTFCFPQFRWTIWGTSARWTSHLILTAKHRPMPSIQL